MPVSALPGEPQEPRIGHSPSTVAQRKQQLLDAAAELFAANGYAATRVEDICRRAGVAKGLFYWYFPTKQELFAELVRTMRQRLRRAQAEAMDPQADCVTRIRQGTEASVRFHAEHAGYFALLDVERADASHAEVLREGGAVYLPRRRRARDAPASAKGTIRDGDPGLLALGVLGAVSSFTHAWRNGRTEVDADELAERCRRLGHPRAWPADPQRPRPPCHGLIGTLNITRCGAAREQSFVAELLHVADPGRPALIEDGRQLTYAELAARGDERTRRRSASTDAATGRSCSSPAPTRSSTSSATSH